MVIPRWLLFVLAAWVIIFGSYRMWVAFGQRRNRPSAPSRFHEVAAFGRTRRAHGVYGALYLILGAMLVASGFGVPMPFASSCQQVLGVGKDGQPVPDGRTLDVETTETPVLKQSPAPAPQGEAH